VTKKRIALFCCDPSWSEIEMSTFSNTLLFSYWFYSLFNFCPLPIPFTYDPWINENLFALLMMSCFTFWSSRGSDWILFLQLTSIYLKKKSLPNVTIYIKCGRKKPHAIICIWLLRNINPFYRLFLLYRWWAGSCVYRRKEVTGFFPSDVCLPVEREHSSFIMYIRRTTEMHPAITRL
jgi:hypothetical protein